MSQYQESVNARNPNNESAKYDITVFGTPCGHRARDNEASCCLQIWLDGAIFSITIRLEDARALAQHLALAAAVAEAGEPQLIDFALQAAA
jgi:hypothetical protein